MTLKNNAIYDNRLWQQLEPADRPLRTVYNWETGQLTTLLLTNLTLCGNAVIAKSASCPQGPSLLSLPNYLLPSLELLEQRVVESCKG